MIAVFLGFATDPDPVIKMTGVGLASAVLVDITLARPLAGDASLSVMAGWLERMGHRPHRSGITWSVGCSDRALDALEARAERIVAEAGRERQRRLGRAAVRPAVADKVARLTTV